MYTGYVLVFTIAPSFFFFFFKKIQTLYLSKWKFLTVLFVPCLVLFILQMKKKKKQ